MKTLITIIAAALTMYASGAYATETTALTLNAARVQAAESAAFTKYASRAHAAEALDIADHKFNCQVSITYAHAPESQSPKIMQTISLNGTSIEDFRHYLSKVVTVQGYSRVKAKIACQADSLNVIETVEWIDG